MEIIYGETRVETIDGVGTIICKLRDNYQIRVDGKYGEEWYSRSEFEFIEKK